jgi:hypothetical protein
MNTKKAEDIVTRLLLNAAGLKYGTGANGKSTFLNVIMHILGDYATATPTETFMKRTNDSLTNDIPEVSYENLQKPT